MTEGILPGSSEEQALDPKIGDGILSGARSIDFAEVADTLEQLPGPILRVPDRQNFAKIVETHLASRH